MSTFARDGYPSMIVVTILGFLIASIGLWVPEWLSYFFYIAGLLLVLLVFYFFRDPDRDLPSDPNVVVAPADGKILFIKEVDEPIFLNGKGKQISIFLSLFDVHVNRNPMSGRVDYLKYHPGDYLVAWHDKASELNERAEFGVTHESGTKIFYRQITGLVARRIVYRVEEGDQLVAGERFGMMKFGSRMDIIVPDNVKLTVKEKEHTVGGETILGVIE
ncbi:MAG: phosphatidylserine decarboxylase family protein [Bacteroidota bacterium]